MHAVPQAALTVARRVAQEVGCAVGAGVGYRVRFEERVCRATRIVYLTGLAHAPLPRAPARLPGGAQVPLQRTLSSVQAEHLNIHLHPRAFFLSFLNIV
jgi:hypothetical protein